MESLSVYVHWPFCLSKCAYCAFYSLISDDSLYNSVLAKIISDIERYTDYIGKRHIDSIFFGGGTPSLIHPSDIAHIIDFIALKHNISTEAEITLEANPDTLDSNNLLGLKTAGINRLSLGVQSFNDDELRFLGRRCNARTATRVAELVRNFFGNFSFDMIYGFAAQTKQGLENTLLTALSFGPSHMSCYKLTFEEGTRMFQSRELGEVDDITDEEDEELSNTIEEILEHNNLRRYEISNYAKCGHESVHNCAYWNYFDYLGIGPSAHSRITVDGSKCAVENPKSINQWLDSHSPLVKLSDTEVCEEAIIMGLRTIFGVNEKYFKPGVVSLNKIYQFISDGVLIRLGNRVKIARKYLNLCDYITEEIIC